MRTPTSWFKKSAVVLFCVPFAVGLLSGCAAGNSTGNSSSRTNQVGNQSVNQSANTSANQVAAGNQTGRQEGNQAGQTSGRNEASTSANSSNSNQASSSQPSAGTTSVRIPAKTTLSYQIEGETDTKSASAYISSNQPFYMYVLSGFKATPEEPGKDVVDFTVNHDAWMRVEVLRPGLTTSQIEQDARNILSATSSSIHAITANDLPTDPFFKGTLAWYANGSKESSMVFVAKVDGTYVRFFVHVPLEWESPAQFEAMMATLHVVQPNQSVSTT